MALRQDAMINLYTEPVVWSVPTRMAYIQSFIHFDPHRDGQLLNASQTYLTDEAIDRVSDAIYDTLLARTHARGSFTQDADKGDHVNGISELEHHKLDLQCQRFAKKLLTSILTNNDWSPSSDFWVYLNKTGRRVVSAHGDLLQARQVEAAPVAVHIRDVALLLSRIEDTLTEVLVGVDDHILSVPRKTAMVRAWSKYWCIYNDLLTKAPASRPEKQRLGGWMYLRQMITRVLALQNVVLVLGLVAVAIALHPLFRTRPAPV